ncbi:MAG: hypothetical protein RR394_07820 [Oscillospiraceae bacterium]
MTTELKSLRKAVITRPYTAKICRQDGRTEHLSISAESEEAARLALKSRLPPNTQILELCLIENK